MAKFYNNRVKTGRLAGSVFAIRNGETIERAYQPIVANPSTPAQVAVRAKLKLLSQLGAVLGPTIAIKRQGPVSSRNLFTKKNYGITGFENNQATITLTEVQLTNGVVNLPPISTQRQDTTLTVSIGGASNDIDRVVYIVVLKGSDGKLRVLSSAVVERGSEPTFPTTFTVSPLASVVVFAYGVRANTTAGKAIFGNLTALTAETVAKIVTSRSVLDSDITLTETIGIEVTPGQ